LIIFDVLLHHYTTQNNFNMSGGIENAGRKGKILAGIVIFLILFIAVWAKVYYANQNGLN